MTKKRKQADVESETVPVASSSKAQKPGEGDAAFKNKEKVLILSTRGITFR